MLRFISKSDSKSQKEVVEYSSLLVNSGRSNVSWDFRLLLSTFNSEDPLLPAQDDIEFGCVELLEICKILDFVLPT